MTNKVFVTAAFKREAKRLIKKYLTLQTSIDNLIQELSANAFAGDAYGEGIYKVRLADKSKGKGKSGGFRVMYYHLSKTDSGFEILLMSIYDKSEKATIKKAEALSRLKEILQAYSKSGL